MNGWLAYAARYFSEERASRPPIFLFEKEKEAVQEEESVPLVQSKLKQLEAPIEQREERVYKKEETGFRQKERDPAAQQNRKERGRKSVSLLMQERNATAKEKEPIQMKLPIPEKERKEETLFSFLETAEKETRKPLSFQEESAERHTDVLEELIQRLGEMTAQSGSQQVNVHIGQVRETADVERIMQKLTKRLWEERNSGRKGKGYS